ncbi:MAG TPA: hypothetical protein VKK61_04035 [Tepidisphaeraceae bacterium]|nr:hypothetical protein [Tepidisphaeraceae bacterium]
MRWSRLILLFAFASLSCTARGEVPAEIVRKPLFDPARHMRVAEVYRGMKGYGLTVFQGTKIERFNVEVISVLHNFNPKYDVVLIRCLDDRLQHTGAIAGMSGSPIFLTDDAGHDRLIGAFAYGWPLMKDPIAGVQPIEYMLEVGSTLRPEPAATQQSGSFGTTSDHKLCRYDPLHPLSDFSSDKSDAFDDQPHLGDNSDAPQLQYLATPLMTAGVSTKVMQQFAPIFRRYGLVSLQAGGGSSASTQPAAQIEPGSVLAAPLLTGDVDLTAIGTCTEVIGDRVFGFGHPFNNEGPITLPMGSGEIDGIIPSLQQSFKLGAMTQLRGTLIADQVVGVAGKLGKSPPTIPIDLRVIYTDGSMDTTYHFDAAAHPRLTPMLGGMAVAAALSGQRDLPQYHTVDYDLSLEFANGQVVQLKNAIVNNANQALLLQFSGPLMFAAENPFGRVMVKKISGTIRITPEAHEADILSVNLPKMKYKPGETLKAFVRYRPFRQGESILPVELELPHDLRDGTYHLSISDQQTYLEQEEQARPFRFSAESVEDVFGVLKDVGSIRQDAIYVQLLRDADGVAVGRTAMRALPSSRRQVLLDAGLSNVTPFVNTALKIVPTEMVMNGSAEFDIEINSESRVEGPTSRPSKAESKATGAAAPIVVESKPKSPRHDAPGAPKND